MRVRLAHDQEARLRHLRRQRARGLQEVLESLDRAQPAEHRDEGSVRRQAELLMELPVCRLLAVGRGVDAVADDRDPALVVSLVDEPVLHRVGVGHDAIGETTDHALHAPLHRREIGARVPDGGDGDRDARQLRRRNGEDVGIETVGVHDLDPALPGVGGEPEPLPERPLVVELPDVVLDDARGRHGHLLQELAVPPEAGQVQLEACAVEPLGHGDDLALGPADGEHADELEEPDPLGRGETTAPPEPRGGVHAEAARAHHRLTSGDGSPAPGCAPLSAHHVSRIATASPAM